MPFEDLKKCIYDSNYYNNKRIYSDESETHCIPGNEMEPWFELQYPVHVSQEYDAV
jgi:hypothetical protein